MHKSWLIGARWLTTEPNNVIDERQVSKCQKGSVGWLCVESKLNIALCQIRFSSRELTFYTINE